MSLPVTIKNVLRSCVDYVRYGGGTYYCPLCKRYAGKFPPNPTAPGQAIIDAHNIVSMGKRPHYRCPWCNSSDKERLVWMFLKNKTDILAGNSPRSLLHVAPEKNTMRLLKDVPGLSYIAGDMFEGDERYTSGRYGDAVYLDVTDMSRFNNETFDAVICNHVLEHVPNDRKGMQEILRVLKQDGFAVLQVPVSRTIASTIEVPAQTPGERLEEFGQADHVRIYGEQDYINRLTQTGFVVEAVRPQDIVDKVDLFGINTNERIYVARKTGSL
jgi:SAM-dependent methyltransferase